MSTWIKIKDQDNVELSDDGKGKTIEVLYSCDQFGNNYIEIPIEFIERLLDDKSK